MLYLEPKTLDEALSALAEGGVVPIAGGTDVYPAWANGAPPHGLLDITRVREFDAGIEERSESWFIHPLTTWTAVVDAPLPPYFDALRQAAREVGGRQIQNRGTVVGNICNASPAADGTVALMSVDAVVELASRRERRAVPLADFVVGNRRTLKRSDELVVGIEIRKKHRPTTSVFRKLGTRRYLVISIAMTAVMLEVEHGTIRDIAVCVGACSAHAVRIRSIEERLRGQALDAAKHSMAVVAELPELSPISDVRATAGYRTHAARSLVHNAIADCIAKFA
jgi:CO/xanthine dehydrogenase FAD-binding subunit